MYLNSTFLFHGCLISEELFDSRLLVKGRVIDGLLIFTRILVKVIFYIALGKFFDRAETEGESASSFFGRRQNFYNLSLLLFKNLKIFLNF